MPPPQCDGDSMPRLRDDKVSVSLPPRRGDACDGLPSTRPATVAHAVPLDVGCRCRASDVETVGCAISRMGGGYAAADVDHSFDFRKGIEVIDMYRLIKKFPGQGSCRDPPFRP